MGLTAEDEGLGIIRLQEIPRKSGKGNQPEAKGGSSGQWTRIPRAIRGVLPVEGNTTRIYHAEDTGVERVG